MPPRAVADFVVFLNTIEDGANWPRALTQARVAFLAKDTTNSLDPLAYRLLAILPTLYRRWASTRLRALAPWVTTWQLHEMYAGPPGRGAQDTWYSTSNIREYCHISGIDYQFGTTDLWKCFDQHQRELQRLGQDLAPALPPGGRQPSVQAPTTL